MPSGNPIFPLQEKILLWYDIHKRDLPWRKTDDPYKILVSEMMLQQTQVDRVIPKYTAFLERFPTIADLACAKRADVITLWSGLGYNRRAIYLHACAQAVIERGGTFPTTADELQTLPGIGPYTSQAIQSFAFHLDVPVVDTNIRRIFSRVFFSGKGTPQEIDTAVFEAVPTGKGTDWNNALMDFGSMVCVSGTPHCKSCPLQSICTAFQTGNQHRYLRIAPPQKRFQGSRRQYRGMVLKLLKDAPNHTASMRDIIARLDKPQEFVVSILAELERDQLITKNNRLITLP